MPPPLPDLTARVRFALDAAGLTAAQARLGGLVTAVKATSAEIVNADAKSRAALTNLSKGALVAGAGVTAGFGLVARATLGFDKEISEVAAASDATGATLGRLRDAALEAGAATVFSASEAALAQAELAKAGISSADILGGALRGSLDLAAAGSLDLGRAAEIAAGAMTVFNLSGADVGHVADVLSAGANKSSATVEGLADALAQSGLVAAQFDLSLEDTVGLLAQFAQAGLKGSDAGTSLKTALQRFVPQSKEARDAMAALGIELFDTQGRFVGIQAAAQELQDGLASLSDEQQATALTTIFGADAIRAATILYQGGGRAVGEWRDRVNDAGAASETAAKKLDNLAGDLEALGGSIETALIESGSTANGVLRTLAQGATGAVNAFAEMPTPIQATITGIAGIAGPTLLAAGATGALIPKIATARESLEKMGAAGTAASRGLGLLGKTGGAAAGIGLVAGLVEVLTDQLLRLQHGSGPNLSELANDLVRFGESGRAGGELVTEFGDDLSGLAEKLKLLQDGSVLGRPTGLFSKGIFDTGSSESDLRDAERDIDALDESLAQLVRGGHSEEAARIFALLVESLQGTGIGTAELQARLDEYLGSLADVDTEQRLAEKSTTSLTGKVEGLAAAFAETDEAAADRLEATIAQLEADLDAGRALTSFGDAVDDVAAKERDLADARRDRTDAARDAISVERALNGVEDARTAILDRERDLADARAGRGAKAREIIEAERALASAQRAYNEAASQGSDALEERAEAAERLADARLRLDRALQDGGREADVADAVEALSRAELDSREANLSLSDARQRSAERDQATAARVAQAEEELLASRENAKAAAVAAARSAQDLAEQQATAAGRVLTAGEKYSVFRDKLIELKDTLAPGSKLRTDLEGMIDKLGEIPPAKDLVITADTQQAREQLGLLREQYINLLDEVEATGPSMFGPIGGGITSAQDTLGALREQYLRLLSDVEAQGPTLFGPVGGGITSDEKRKRRTILGATFHDGGLVRQMVGRLPELGPREVPAVLEHGEFVINADSASRIGLSALERLNRFHDGGLVDLPELRVPELHVPELRVPAMAGAGPGQTSRSTTNHWNLPPIDVRHLAREVARIQEWEEDH